MKKVIVIMMLVLCVILVGCMEEKKSADQKLSQQTEQAMQEANSKIGMPAIRNFQERKLAKMIFELRDQENLICHAYLVNQMTGQIGQYLGKCIGFGLPYSVQYTNPEKLINHRKEYIGKNSMRGDNYGNIPQADPNGLFMPQGLSATWLILINPKTAKARPVYIEPQIIVSPFKLH